MNLRETGVREQRALPVGAPCRGDVRGHGVGREVEHIAVAAGGEHHRVSAVRRQFAGTEVSGDNAGGLPVDLNDLDHLVTVVELYRAIVDLLGQRLVGAQQELLTGLTTRVERAAYLCSTEGTVREKAAVFTGERNSRRHGLVDDVDRDLGQAVHVGLTGPEVATFDGVIEQAVDRVAVAMVILGCVDATLSGDRVGPARRVVEGEDLHVVPEPGQRRRRRRPGQPGTDDDHVEFTLVGRVHQFHGELVVVPTVFDRTRRGLCIKCDVAHGLLPYFPTTPASTAIGKLMLPATIIPAMPMANALRALLNRGLFIPRL